MAASDTLDQVLGLVVEAARAARSAAYDPAPTDPGWLEPSRTAFAVRSYLARRDPEPAPVIEAESWRREIAACARWRR